MSSVNCQRCHANVNMTHWLVALLLGALPAAGASPYSIRAFQRRSSGSSGSGLLQINKAPSVWKAGLEVHYDAHQPYSTWWSSSYPGWESGTFQVFNRFVKGKVVLDVGAWIGPTALWEAQLAQHVVALEPTQAAFREFSANLAANPGIQGSISAVNVALDEEDRRATMSNTGDSTDRISLIDVRSVSIKTLLEEHPVLQQTGFVKIDTEGYERVIVPALESFFKEKKPVVLVSLHPMFISHAEVQGVVDKLKAIFPHLYEADMKTPFNAQRDAYTYGDHGGADVLCSWSPIS